MAIPPDTHGEVDGNYCVTAVNTSVHIQTRTGVTVSNTTIDHFWLSVLAHGNGCFDPRVHYDPHYKRWIMVADAYGQTPYSTLLIGVSKTSDPTGGWYLYSVITDPTGQSWLDFPCVGFNEKWITVTGNFYQNVTGTGVKGAVVYVFNYATLMAGTGAPYTKISETSEFTLSPALTYDTTQQSMFLLNINNSNTGKLRLWKITGPVGTPVIASVGYPTSAQHWHNGGSNDFVPQLGTTDLIQAGDDRITHVVYRNHALWCSYTAFMPDPGTATRCSIMWWQIDTLANPIQIGLIDDPTTPSFFDYSSIAVNKNNDVLIGFSYTSSQMYASAAYRLHMHYDPLDSMRPAVIFRHGQRTYFQNFGGTQDRWGDYSSSCVDPTNNTDFWTIQESVSATPSNLWDTWWASVSLCPARSVYTKSADTVAKGFNDTLTFSGAATAGATYAWNFSGGTASPGTGAGPQHVKWYTPGWHVVTLSVTDSGCTSVFKDSIFVKSNVAVSSLTSSGDDYEILPNPNDGTFSIISSLLVNPAVEVKIADMQGRIVYKQKLEVANNNTLYIKTENLSSGNYIVTINNGGTLVNKKVTISN